MKLFLIAGEPSGDRLGAALMAGLKALAPGVAFAGVGGPLMQAEGLAQPVPDGGAFGHGHRRGAAEVFRT